GRGPDNRGACTGDDRQGGGGDDKDKDRCGGSDDRDGRGGDVDDHECGGSDKDCERDRDDGCGGVLVHFRVSATDPGTDDLTFTWAFPDGTVVTHTFFNNGVSPDPRPSSLGSRPMTATDSLAHSLCQPCGKAVSLTVSDDDGGVTTLVFTIKP